MCISRPILLNKIKIFWIYVEKKKRNLVECNLFHVGTGEWPLE